MSFNTNIRRKVKDTLSGPALTSHEYRVMWTYWDEDVLHIDLYGIKDAPIGVLILDLTEDTAIRRVVSYSDLDPGVEALHIPLSCECKSYTYMALCHARTYRDKLVAYNQQQAAARLRFDRFTRDMIACHARPTPNNIYS